MNQEVRAGYQSQPGAKVQYYLGQTGTNLYFAGRLVYRNNNFITAAQDRLGSFGSYYPYGEEYATTQQDQVKFATYYRDTTTVLDYARNRYYSSTLRVGIHDFTFEACSSFTRVTACRVACPPKGGLLSRGFDPASYPTKPLGSYHVSPTTT